MGIKVLLADDSAAIKKVVQLCLSDFGVELKSLGSGNDVYDLAKNFKPDIALIDVMLPHKPGFEVASEIKKDPQLKTTPIIMLWSNFMEFDEAKFKASGAEAKLEKPFDAKDLRELVQKLIPKTQSNTLSQFLELPKLDFKTPPSAEHSKTNIQTSTSTLSSTGVDLSHITTTNSTKPPETDGDSEWVRKDLGKFKVEIDSDGFDDTVSFQYDETQLQTANSIMKARVGEPAPTSEPVAAPIVSPTEAPAARPIEATVKVELDKRKEKPAKNTSVTPQKVPAPAMSPAATAIVSAPSSVNPEEVKTLMEKQIAEIVQKEVREVLEKAVWKLVPEIATKIIKEEISRLTSEN